MSNRCQALLDRVVPVLTKKLIRDTKMPTADKQGKRNQAKEFVTSPEGLATIVGIVGTVAVSVGAALSKGRKKEPATSVSNQQRFNQTNAYSSPLAGGYETLRTPGPKADPPKSEAPRYEATKSTTSTYNTSSAGQTAGQRRWDAPAEPTPGLQASMDEYARRTGGWNGSG